MTPKQRDNITDAIINLQLQIEKTDEQYSSEPNMYKQLVSHLERVKVIHVNEKQSIALFSFLD